MTPVIRISEEIFTRLQGLAEPLVDTPASVIQRLLDQHDGKADDTRSRTGRERVVLPEFQADKWEGACNSLYLAPGSTQNIQKTIAGSVALDQIQAQLTPLQYISLKQALAGSLTLKCFAVKERSRNDFESMVSGDIVLFAEKGAGRFGFVGRVLTKLESENLGGLLWSDPDWRFIYILDRTWRANIDKKKTLLALGYDEGFWLPRFMRVKHDVLVSIKKRFGSLADFLGTLQKPS
ncbi:MAG: hypothetical protein WC655_08390 [Candidatus Hydrogenedentales bacterium]|jgi:hypothetical protein